MARAGACTSTKPACAAPEARPKPSVIFVREWEQQMSGSGCCGRLGGDALVANGERIFADRRAIMEALGPLYAGIRREFGDTVEVLVVDPRNQISMLVRVVRDLWRFRVGLLEAIRTLGRISIPTVIVNGRIFARGAWPEVAPTVRHLRGLTSGGRRGDAVG